MRIGDWIGSLITLGITISLSASPTQKSVLKPAHSLLPRAEAAPSMGRTLLSEVQGVWEFQHDGTLIQVELDGEEMVGTIYRRPNGRKDEVDKYNPNPAQRHNPIVGLRVFWGLKKNSDGSWSGGKVYDPDSGTIYEARASLQPDGTLKFSGYVWLPWIGRSEVLKRHPPTAL